MSEKGWVATLVERLTDDRRTIFSLVFLVVGLGLFLLGLAGGVTYNKWLPIEERQNQAAVTYAGIAFIALGLLTETSLVLDSKSSLLDPDLYEVKITHPHVRDKVDTVTVRGTIKNELPSGYTLQVMRVFPNGAGFLPTGKAVEYDWKQKQWKSYDCQIGGKKGELRAFGVWIVGPAGKILLNFYDKAHSVDNANREVLQRSNNGAPEVMDRIKAFPLLTEGTPDMHRCDSVDVLRA